MALCPPDWAVDYGCDDVTVRHVSTGCGIVFYPDRDPLMFSFLKALGGRAVGDDSEVFLAGPEEETP